MIRSLDDTTDAVRREGGKLNLEGLYGLLALLGLDLGVRNQPAPVVGGAHHGKRFIFEPLRAARLLHRLGEGAVLLESGHQVGRLVCEVLTLLALQQRKVGGR